MAAGRRPNLCGIDAEALGLTLAPNGAIQVDGNQETSLPGVYAIGDAAFGHPLLAHAAYAEGEAALAAILGTPRPVGDTPIPSCIYTTPCFATVGLSAPAAQQAGRAVVTGSFPYAANGMALAEGASGAVYVVMDRDEKTTLGVTIVGENAAELITIGALAVTQHLTLADWERLIVPHPSLAEMLREAALDAFGLAVHKR